MADYKLKGLRSSQRRRFVKMMGVAAAAMGMEHSGLLNFLNDQGGIRLAQAATNGGMRAVAVTGGSGSYAWFQQLWPCPDVANEALSNGSFGGTSAYLYTSQHGYLGPDGSYIAADDNQHHYYYGPHAPWFDQVNKRPLRPMTAIIAGNDETHTPFPSSAAIVSGNASLTATIGAIQATKTNALVPVIGIDPLKYGAAQGAPDVVTAPSAEGIIDLFNSAASKLTLANPEDQELFETYYKAFAELRRASGRSSWEGQLKITKNAARLIGVNLAAALTPTNADLDAYGITALLQADLSAKQMEGLENFGRTLITSARAFRLGLSNSAIIGLSPGPTSEQTFTDPHDTFNTPGTKIRGRNVSMHLGQILDAFYTDLAQFEDPECPGQKLDETTVFLAYGDTPHTPLEGDNWPDATPQDCNWLYVMGQGYLKPGWFGGVRPNGDVDGFDPATGDYVLNKPATETSTAAGAAAAYAVARGDMNTVAQYYVGPPIDGLLAS